MEPHSPFFLAARVLFLATVSGFSLGTLAGESGATEYVLDASWPQSGAKSLGIVSGVAVDTDDSVWVFRRAKPYVQVIDSAGRPLSSWDVSFVKPHQIRLSPDGSVWATDYVGEVVKKFSRSGDLLMTLGTPGKQGTDSRHFYLPTDVVADPRTGDLFVADGYGNARIVHFDKVGKYVGEFGHHGAAPGEMNLPHAIVMDSKGNLYEADRDNGRVQVFDQTGKLLRVWDFMAPWGLWMTKHDELWICGTSPRPRNHSLWKSAPPRDQIVMQVNASGDSLGRWQFPRGQEDKCKPGELSWVHCIAVDSHQNLYLGDVRGNGLQKFRVKRKD